MTIELLDRTIFELLRLEAVRVGVSPDWRSLNGTRAEKLAAYKAAQVEIINNKFGVVEVISTGHGESRGKKSYNQITLNRLYEDEGSIVSHGGEYYYCENTQDNNTVDKVKYPSNSTLIGYEIRTFSQSVKWERIMRNIITNSLKKFSTFKVVDADWRFVGETFILRGGNGVNVTSTDTLEWVFGYQVIDVYIDEYVETIAPVKMLLEVEATQKVDDLTINTLNITE